MLIGVVLIQTGAQAAEPVVALKEGAGRELVQGMCNTCHSTDYIVINSRFMDEQKWVAVMDKMVKTFGAPIDADSQKIIVRYLSEQYGVAAQ
jgi:hypothetical protein